LITCNTSASFFREHVWVANQIRDANYAGGPNRLDEVAQPLRLSAMDKSEDLSDLVATQNGAHRQDDTRWKPNN
jgi:hypothetical protein